MSKKLVKKYYGEYGIKEWKRLVKNPYHQLEFDTTMHFLKKYLPKKGLILDAGGGPGRYTIELAKSGYDIILFDLTPELLQIAERKIKKEKIQDKVKIIQGSIDNLSKFRNNNFDAVICLGGALSHLVNKKQREKATDELVRAAKKNALIFITAIGRLAILANDLVNFPEEIEIKKLSREVRDTGNYHGGYGFTACHFYLPEELRESFEKRKIKILEMIGLEGLSTGHPKETNRLFKKYPKAWKIWKETHLKTCTHPCVVGISEHILIVGRK